MQLAIIHLLPFLQNLGVNGSPENFTLLVGVKYPFDETLLGASEDVATLGVNVSPESFPLPFGVKDPFDETLLGASADVVTDG